VINLLTDLNPSHRATFASKKFGSERGNSLNFIIPTLPVLPNHLFPKLIPSAAADSTLKLLDTPATLCPEEYEINNV